MIKTFTKIEQILNDLEVTQTRLHRVMNADTEYFGGIEFKFNTYRRLNEQAVEYGNQLKRYPPEWIEAVEIVKALRK